MDDCGGVGPSFPKRLVNMFAVEEAMQRINCLRRFPPIAGAVEYTSVDVSPLRVTLREVSSSDQSGFGPLPRKLSEEGAKPILKQLVRLMYGLHKRRAACGTLSPASFLWHRATGDVRMTGHVIPPTWFVNGSPPHVLFRKQCAPEVAAGVAYGPPADVWALGVVMLHLLGGPVDYETDDLVDTNVVSPAINAFSPVLVSLICQCLKADAAARPTVLDIVTHPFLREGLEDILVEDRSDGFDGTSDDASETEEEEEEQDEESDEESDDEEVASSDDDG